MKKQVFAMTFEVTTTLQSGKERTVKKKVYSDRFKNGRFFVEDERIRQATELLRAQHYYNIKYLETNATSLLMI